MANQETAEINRLVEWLQSLGCPYPVSEIRTAARRLAVGDRPNSTGNSELGSALRFLSNNVYSADYVQHVRRNLALSSWIPTSEHCGTAKSEVLESRQLEELEKRIGSLNNQISELKKNISREMEELTREEALRRSAVNSVSCDEQKTVLLSSVANSSNFGQLDAQILEARDRLSRVLSEASGAEVVSGRPTKREQVLEACQTVAACLFPGDTEKGETKTTDFNTEAMREFIVGSEICGIPASKRLSVSDFEAWRAPEQAIRVVTQVLKSGGAEDIISGAISAAEMAQQKLGNSLSSAECKTCDGSSLVQATKAERYGGTETPGKENMEPIQTQTANRACQSQSSSALDNELREMQKQHLESFITAQKALCRSKQLQKRFVELCQQVANSDGGAQELQDRKSSARIVGIRAGTETLSREVEKLRAEAVGVEDTAFRVRQMWEDIKRCRGESACLDHTIDSAQRYSLVSGKRLLLDCAAVRKRLEGEVAHSAKCLAECLQRAGSAFRQEVLDFQEVPLTQFAAVGQSESSSREPIPSSGDWMQSGRRFSLHRMERAFQEAAGSTGAAPDPLRGVLGSLQRGAPATGLAAPEELLSRVLRSLRLAEAHRCEAAPLHRALAGPAQELLRSQQSAAPGREELAGRFREAERRALDRLQQAAQDGRRGVEAAEGAHELLGAWWEQPASRATPWVRVAANGSLRIRPLLHEQPEEAPPEERRRPMDAHEWQSHLKGLAARIEQGAE